MTSAHVDFPTHEKPNISISTHLKNAFNAKNQLINQHTLYSALMLCLQMTGSEKLTAT